MAENFTGRRRMRKRFGSIAEVAEMPNLIEVQKSSYDDFLMVKEPAGGRPETGLQAVHNCGRQALGQVVLGDDMPGVTPRGRVGDGGAAGNDVEGTADDVAEHKGYQARRIDGAGQLAALDQAEVFAQAVDLADRGAAGEEGSGQNLEIGEADTGRFEQS